MSAIVRPSEYGGFEVEAGDRLAWYETFARAREAAVRMSARVKEEV